MRIPPNLKYLIFFIAAIIIIVLATMYLPLLIPNIGKILTNLLIGGMALLIILFFIKPFFSFLYARADGIFAVYLDINEKGLHIFANHLNSSGDNMDSTRDIQHYFIEIETGKLYYHKMFSHDMVPTTERSGWGDFYSFEESVLASEHLKKSLKILSHKTKSNLQPGKKLTSIGDEEYALPINETLIEIKHFENTFDSGFKITSKNLKTNLSIWSKKI